ncbi:hypothetical protein QLT08_02660 [Streptococcus equi subsp. zooepidemicus]|nr:hypothetical protein [Streptococcus equi subsp. zooepidemicus]HEL1034942.1 hypothetical protein [Streptococcus equi subsp. zooepidemicus]
MAKKRGLEDLTSDLAAQTRISFDYFSLLGYNGNREMAVAQTTTLCRTV